MGRRADLQASEFQEVEAWNHRAPHQAPKAEGRPDLWDGNEISMRVFDADKQDEVAAHIRALQSRLLEVEGERDALKLDQDAAWRRLESKWDALKAQPPVGVAAGVFAELERATRKFPTWPTDPLHALAVLGEEFGELTKEVLQSTYEPHKSSPKKVREEAVQTAAMALRFLASLDAYVYQRGPQHSQAALATAATPESKEKLP